MDTTSVLILGKTADRDEEKVGKRWTKHEMDIWKTGLENNGKR